jgi:hypothetical protein
LKIKELLRSIAARWGSEYPPAGFQVSNRHNVTLIRKFHNFNDLELALQFLEP